MNQKIGLGSDFEQARRRYADLFGRATAVYGLTPLLGRLYGTLLLSAAPMPLDDLTRSVDAAKSTVSVAMRQLETYRLVRREWARGDRRDFFVARIDFAAMLQEWHRLFFQQEMRFAQEANAEVRARLDQAAPEGGWPSADEQAVLRQRLDDIDQLIAASQGWFEALVDLVGQTERRPAQQIPIQVEP